MDVLYIVTKLELGGAQKICVSLMQGLKNIGQNTILISGNEGKLVNNVKDMDQVILIGKLKREVSVKYFFIELINFIELIQTIKKLKKRFPNIIVHTHSTKAGIIGRWAAFFAGIKTRIHTIHGYGFNNYQHIFVWWIIYLLELITSLITTHYVCVSTKDIETGIKLFPKFGKKHSLIRAAIDWNQFYFAKKIPNNVNNKKTFIFGTVSCFKKQKNLLDLFKAFQKVLGTNSDCILEVIGDGVLRNVLEQWIIENDLVGKIILHGWKDRVSECMLNWDAFVLSSLWEGLPCAVVEARLLKLPVIAYDTGGISDVIIQYKNGILCKQGDWLALANNMLIVSKDNKLQSYMKNYSENLKDFDDSIMIQKHFELYKRLQIYD